MNYTGYVFAVMTPRKKCAIVPRLLFIMVFSLVSFIPGLLLAASKGERIELDSSMLTNETGFGSPRSLIDEQTFSGSFTSHQPESGLEMPYQKRDEFPAHFYIDFGELLLWEQTDELRERLQRRKKMLAKAHQEKKNRKRINAGKPFDKLPLIQEVIAGKEKPGVEFSQSSASATRTKRVFGHPIRVMPHREKPSYFAYRIGSLKTFTPCSS